MPQPAATPQLLRRVKPKPSSRLSADSNRHRTELMARSGLTRASVIAICEDLIRRGWIRELDAPQRDPEAPGTLRKGRPARRFETNSEAGYVLGLDIGAATTMAVVADLRGTVLARASEAFRAIDIPADERIAVVDRACRRALVAAGRIPPESRGRGRHRRPRGPRRQRPGNRTLLEPVRRRTPLCLQELHGWTVLLENDANLAALGERWRGTGSGVDDLVVLLAGERLGAGVMESGRLLHGRGGAAGEMGYLDLVEGVGSSDGIASLARQWSAAGGGPPAGGAASARRVFEDAAAGDPAALQILERISERMARVIASIASLINPEQVVIGGAVAESAGALLPRISALLPRFTATPPRVTVSPLGDSIVTMGAIRHALDYVEANALELELPTPA